MPIFKTKDKKNSSTTEYSFPLTLNLWEIKSLERFLGGYTEKALRYFINKKNENVKELEKNRNGKTRIVYNQSAGYKELLRIINKNLVRRIRYPKGVLGGVKGKTINDMATPHCGKEATFGMDLKNFFPSISDKMVYRFFKRAKCSDEIAEILTDLVTFEQKLPQGFPTSTTIANLVAYDLDIKHLDIAERHHLVRTRWIDDIAFSGRKSDVKNASRNIIDAVKQVDLKINYKKTRYRPRDARKETDKPIVTGLRTNHKTPRVPQKRIGEIEKLLENCETIGFQKTEQIFKSEIENRNKDFRASLKGKIDFVRRYDKENGLVLERRMNAICVEEQKT
jgi:RNA-directed DNA polymerase